MTIVPDDKDWTWVLERPCPECGLDLSSVDPGDIGSRLRANVAEWPALLDHPAATVRPNDGQWSALEYACHVRDVFRLFVIRLDGMLTDDDPLFPNWDPDATAIEDRYSTQQPATVAAELVEAGAALASGSTQCAQTSGAGPGDAATVPRSPWPALASTCCTTPCTTCGTSGLRTNGRSSGSG